MLIVSAVKICKHHLAVASASAGGPPTDASPLTHLGDLGPPDPLDYGLSPNGTNTYKCRGI